MIIRQPWYNGKVPDSKFRFVTGGWWTARTRVLHQYDYPFKEIVHNGGDTVLGELMRQRNLRIKHFRDGVKINADESGRESKAARRGVSLKPTWYNQSEGKSDMSHHRFDIQAIDLRQTAFPPAASYVTKPADKQVMPAAKPVSVETSRRYGRRMKIKGL